MDAFRRPRRPGPPLLLCAALASPLTIAAPAGAQIPAEFQNLQVLPESIPRDSLIQLMRTFSFATGLQCEGCHVMGEEGSFQGARFHLDDKPEKERARTMLRMVDRLNGEILTQLPGREEPPLRVECKSCHRGLRKPFLLRTELLRVVEQEGVEAAEERYRALREQRMDLGAYDFREWEMNELARELEARGLDAAAAAMLELNEEFHPTSASIPRLLGTLYERLDRPEDAVAAYARALGRNPGNPAALARLQEALARLEEPAGGGLP